MECAVQLFVVNLPGLDFFDVSAGNPFDATLYHQRFGKSFGVGDVTAALDMDAAHTEIAKFIFVADPDQARLIANLGFPQDVIHIVDILESGALTGAGPMSCADD